MNSSGFEYRFEGGENQGIIIYDHHLGFQGAHAIQLLHDGIQNLRGGEWFLEEASSAAPGHLNGGITTRQLLQKSQALRHILGQRQVHQHHIRPKTAEQLPRRGQFTDHFRPNFPATGFFHQSLCQIVIAIHNQEPRAVILRERRRPDGVAGRLALQLPAKGRSRFRK